MWRPKILIFLIAITNILSLAMSLSAHLSISLGLMSEAIYKSCLASLYRIIQLSSKNCCCYFNLTNYLKQIFKSILIYHLKKSQVSICLIFSKTKSPILSSFHLWYDHNRNYRLGNISARKIVTFHFNIFLSVLF